MKSCCYFPDIRAPAAVICFLDHQLIPKPPNLRRYDRMCRVCIWNDAEMIISIGLQLFESFFWHLALKNRLWRGMSWVEFTALTLFRDNLNWSELAFHGFLVICLKFISFQRLKKVAKKLKSFKVSSIFGRTVWDQDMPEVIKFSIFWGESNNTNSITEIYRGISLTVLLMEEILHHLDA